MSNAIPHASPQCLSACAYLGLVLCGLIHGIDRDEVLAPNWQPLLHLKELHPLHPEIADVAAGTWSPAGSPRAELRLLPGGGKLVRVPQ